MSLAACVWLGLLVAASPDTPFGPFHQRSHAAISDNRLSYTGSQVTPVAPGHMRAQLSLSQANVWAQMPGYFYDGEWTRLQARFTYGILPHWEAWAELALVGRSGGFLDGFIEAFHRTFHVTQARRDQYPKNRLRLATIQDGTTTERLGEGDAGVGLANAVIGTKWLLSGEDGRAPKLAVEAALQLPWGSTGRQFAIDRIGLMAALALQQPFLQRFCVDAAFGLVLVPGSHQVYGIALTEVQKFLMVTLQMRLWQTGVLALAYLNQDGIAERAAVFPLNATSHEFWLGLRAVAWEVTWEVGIIENTVHDANTADFGMFAGAAYGF